jgi:hypothetical protein
MPSKSPQKVLTNKQRRTMLNKLVSSHSGQSFWFLIDRRPVAGKMLFVTSGQQNPNQLRRREKKKNLFGGKKRKEKFSYVQAVSQSSLSAPFVFFSLKFAFH